MAGAAWDTLEAIFTMSADVKRSQGWLRSGHFSTHFGITSAHTNPSPRIPNTALGGARKGTGDTKIQNGVLLPVQHSLWDPQCPHQPLTQEPKYRNGEC